MAGSADSEPAIGTRNEVFDVHAEEYNRVVDRSVSFTGRNASFFAWRKVELLDRQLSSLGRDLSLSTVLDVGCGTGTTDRHLVGRVQSLHGVDVAEQMVTLARRNVPEAQFQSYDGQKLPFADGSFDLVVAICVLHHVPPLEHAHFIEELVRVAGPRGLVAIFEHNPSNPLTRRAVRGCELDFGVQLLSRGEVAALLEGAGADVLGHDYLLFTPLGGRSGATLDRWLRRLPIGGQHVVWAKGR